MRPAKIQIIMCIRAVWSASSLGAFWIANNAKFSDPDNKNWSDSVDAQSDLSLRWAHSQKVRFFCVVAKIMPDEEIEKSQIILDWIDSTALSIGRAEFQVWACDLDINRDKCLNYMQTWETLIRCRIMRRLILVFTVCQLPFGWSPD